MSEQTEALLAADEEAAKEAAAKPMPKAEYRRGGVGESDDAGYTWLADGGGELEPLLAYTTIISAKWLLKLVNCEVMPEREGVVPAWQDVPPEAIVSLDTLRHSKMPLRLPIAVLSYGWQSFGHPDPKGELLLRLKPALLAMVHSTVHGVDRFAPEQKPVDWGIVWDFMSLPQRGYTTGYDPDRDDRTEYQRERFKRGLRSVNVWYGHAFTTTLVCDWPMPKDAQNAAPIDRRGWCIFERRLSCVRKHGGRCLTLSRLDAQADVLAKSGADGLGEVHWEKLQFLCKAKRYPPLSPDEFEKMMREGVEKEAAEPGAGVRFTNGKDATDICIPQYRECFNRLMPSQGLLDFSHCRWKDADVAQLCASLKAAHAEGFTCKIEILDLGTQMDVTDASVAAIVETCEAGALPNLVSFSIEQNKCTDAGLELLRPLCEGTLSKRLRTLGFGQLLSAKGAHTLAALAAAGHFSKLNILDLRSNANLGDEGVIAIAGAMQRRQLKRLEELILTGCGMGDAGGAELIKGLPECPKLESLTVGKNKFGEETKAAIRAACVAHGTAKALADAFEDL